MATKLLHKTEQYIGLVEAEKDPLFKLTESLNQLFQTAIHHVNISRAEIDKLDNETGIITFSLQTRIVTRRSIES